MPVAKLFLVVRADLVVAQQAVQAVHALRQFVEDHPSVDRDWYSKSNTLALLEVPNEEALGVIYERAMDRRLPVSAFREPDRENEMTALALGPKARPLVRGLPLALRDTA
jgi:peptidyl-tRNA hydrolase